MLFRCLTSFLEDATRSERIFGLKTLISFESRLDGFVSLAHNIVFHIILL